MKETVLNIKTRLFYLESGEMPVNTKAMKQSIIILMYLLEKGTTPVKLLVSTFVALLVSPLALFLQRVKNIIIPDTDFVILIVILLSFDLAFGAWKHLKLGTFCWTNLFTGLLVKILVSFCGMVIFNGLTSIAEFQAHPDLRTYLILLGKVINFFYVGGSAFDSMFVISNGKFPPIGWMKLQKKFNKDVNLNDLKKLVADDSAEAATTKEDETVDV